MSGAIFGCSSSGKKHIGAPSPFGDYYARGLVKHVTVPKFSTLRDTGQTWKFAKPYDVVWAACLEVLSQYQGILSLDASESQGSLLVIKGRETKGAPENRHRISTFGGFYELWLGISVRKLSGSQNTEIAVASYNPNSRKFQNNEVAAQALFAQVQTHVYSRPLWCEKFNCNAPLPIQPTVVTESLFNGVEEDGGYKELEQTLGGWISKRLGVELISTNSPEVVLWLNAIVDKLKESAGAPNVKTNVRIISSNGINAFALTNGNIFISSALLDKLDTADEIAAVLAHELDHILRHDAIGRLKTRQGGEAGAWGVRSALAVGDIAAAFFIPGGGGLGTSILSDVARAGVRNIGEAGAQRMATAFIGDFSATVELRADVEGRKLLQAAGFEDDATVRMLKSLQALKVQALEKKDIVMSNLINIRPGLEDRIKNLEGTLERNVEKDDEEFH